MTAGDENTLMLATKFRSIRGKHRLVFATRMSGGSFGIKQRVRAKIYDRDEKLLILIFGSFS